MAHLMGSKNLSKLSRHICREECLDQFQYFSTIHMNDESVVEAGTFLKKQQHFDNSMSTKK